MKTFNSVERVEVEDDDRLIDKATVVFDDVDGIAADTKFEQQAVRIDIGWTGEKARVFEGIIVQAKTEMTGARRRCTLVAYDLSYKLNQGKAEPKTYAPGRLSAILTSIVTAKPYSLPVGQIKVEEDVEFKDPPLTKGPQSDWAFIQELAVRYNARAFVEVNASDGKHGKPKEDFGSSKFYFISEKFLLDGAPLGKLHFCPGRGELVKFKYERIGSAASPVMSATAVDPKTGIAATIEGTPPPPEPPLTVDADRKAVLDKKSSLAGAAYGASVDSSNKSTGKPEDGRPQKAVTGLSDPDAAKQAIKQDPTRVLGLTGEGVSIGTIKLRAKGKVTISGISPWAEGDWYVRKAVHVFTRNKVLDKDRKEVERNTFRTQFVVTR